MLLWTLPAQSVGESEIKLLILFTIHVEVLKSKPKLWLSP